MEFKDYEQYNMVPREYLGKISKRIVKFIEQNDIKSIDDIGKLEGTKREYGKEDIVINKGDGCQGTSALSIRYRLPGDRVPLKVIFNNQLNYTKISIKGAYILQDYESYQLTRTDWIFSKEWDGVDVEKAKEELRNLESIVGKEHANSIKNQS